MRALKECGYVQVGPVWIISGSGLIYVMSPPEPQASGPHMTWWILNQGQSVTLPHFYPFLSFFPFFVVGYVTAPNGVLVQAHSYQSLVSLCLCAKQEHSSGWGVGGSSAAVGGGGVRRARETKGGRIKNDSVFFFFNTL